MKLKVLPALLASAFVGFATTASAGVIQASYKNYAAEAFGTNVSMTAPTVGYSLALPLTGTLANPNLFTVTYTLTNGGTWVSGNTPDATLVSVNNLDFVAASGPGTIDATGTKLTFQFTLNNGVTFPTNSTIVLGSNGVNVAAADGKIKDVYLTLQKPALGSAYCAPTVQSIDVNIKLTNAAGVEFDSNFPGNSNTTPILQSGVATKTTVKSSALFGPLAANNEASQVNVLIGSLGKLFTIGNGDVTDGLATNDKTIDIGAITFAQNASLFDIDGATMYTVGNANWGVSAAGDGGVSHNGLTFKVTGKFVAGGIVRVNANPDGTGAIVSNVVYNAARTEATVTVTAASMSNANMAAVGGSRTLYVMYDVPGTVVIPTAQFAISEGTLARTAGSGELDTVVCPGNIYNLTANGVQVDVRNYVPQVAQQASGWYSVVRVINTDDIQNASPTAQALLADGTLGAVVDLTTVASVDGKSGPFKPREVRYYTSTTIDTALAAKATATEPTFGAADVGGNARLRIAAPVSSIRVQNYVYNPANQNFIEASSGQEDEGPTAGMLNRQHNK